MSPVAASVLDPAASAQPTVLALNAGDITKVGLLVIAGLILVGIVLSLLISALIARLVIAAIVVVGAVFVWQQRGHVQDAFNAHKCDLNATFFGIHLDAPASVKRACKGT